MRKPRSEGASENSPARSLEITALTLRKKNDRKYPAAKGRNTTSSGFAGTLAPMKKRLIVGITGATGAIYGVRLLETLGQMPDWESHLVLSDAGALNLWHELRMRRKDLEKLATAAYNPKDIGASIASGSFLTEGMVIAPCSMKTLAAVAHAHADDLVSRAADVVLKERRRLVLIPRETPLNLAHLRNMVGGDRDGRHHLPAACPPSMPCRSRSTISSRTRWRGCSTSSACTPLSSRAGRG